MPKAIITECRDLDEVRANINRVDRDLVALLAERGAYVRQAARFKVTADDVRAPARVEAVVGRVRELAGELGASPEVVEQVYRTMIACFIEDEMAEHARMPRDSSTAP